MSTPTIAVTNQKGGVGKTTATINMAGALNARGRNVLVVDLDPQGNLTEGLGFPETYDDEPPSLYDVLLGPDDRGAITEIVREHPEMDLVPSNIDMTVADTSLTEVRRRTEQLNLALEVLTDERDYDYVLIDCPPTLNILTDNALLAAENILIPALAESTSKRAVELLFDHVTSMENDFDMLIRERGLIANRVENTNEATDMMDWFERAFDDTPVWEVRKRVAFQRAFSSGESIYEYDPELDMIEIYDEIAASLDEQFGIEPASTSVAVAEGDE